MDTQNFESSLLARLAVVLACAAVLALVQPSRQIEPAVATPLAAVAAAAAAAPAEKPGPQ